MVDCEKEDKGMKDLKLGFKLIRYGYKLKTNIMMLILFTAIGCMVEISSHGTNMLGGFYFMLTGMFAYQMIIYMNASDYVQSSVMKRKLETGLPAFVSTIVYIVLFTLLLVEKYILIRMYPGNTEKYLDALFMIVLLLFGAMIFCGACYKYFVASFIVFMLVVMFGVNTLNSWLYDHHIFMFKSAGLLKMAIIGYAAIIVGGILEYAVSVKLYEKPLSELAMSGFAKAAK